MKCFKQKTGIFKECLVCRSIFYIQAYLVKSGRKKFCSKDCFYKGRELKATFQKGHPDLVPASSRGHSKETRLKMSGENNHMWKGGISKWGYTGRRDARKLVAHILGRKLKIGEVIHHIDENPFNNDPSNLFLFREQGHHTKWHNLLRKYGRKAILESNLHMV
jgi:hypothetical protein